MKRVSVIVSVLGAVALAGFLSACSDGSPSASASAGGASGSGSASASGTVTGFGSIIVNGKRFETEAASVSIDDQPSSQCAVSPTNRCGLQEGMTVKVSGSFNGSTNRAANIVQEDTLEGPITSVDLANSQFAVLGQTVLVDDTTKFDSGLNFAALVAENVVEVSGFLKSDGVIVASFIERKALVGDCSLTCADGTIAASFIERKAVNGSCSVTFVCEVKGTVKNHSAGSATFEIGGLTVTYDNSTIIGDMPIPSVDNWNGRFVEVKGTNFSVIAGVPTLLATKVEPENDGVGNNVRDEFEVEGYVTQAGSATGNIISFTIGTTPVQTTANTQFRGGTVDEIVVGAKMSAEGRFDGTTLIAKHVKFHASVKLEGNIASINGSTFMIAGLPGIQISVNSQTEGGTNLSVNSHVRVRGRVNGTSSVIATRIELRSQDDDVDLQGPVQSINGQTLIILNTSVDTSGFQNDDFEGLNDQVIGRAAFFNTVTVGTLVKVQGRLSGVTLTWREVELED
ncbi:MAG: hypothetical protein HP494_14060 [Nitrospira sp.]|nr:hypothetical protein [Nitrospira sp.]